MKKTVLTNAKRVLCVVMLLLVATAFMPQTETFAASKKPAKPKVTVSVTATTVTLSWKKAKRAKKYQIYRATSKNGKYKKIKTTKKRSYKNTGLTTGKMYFYKVRSVNGKKKSKFKKVAATPLGTPVCKSSSLITENKIRTNGLKGASGYDVYRSTSSGSGFTYIGSTSSLAFDDWSASVGTTYYYKMRAYKKGSGYKTVGPFSSVARGTKLLQIPYMSQSLVANPDDPQKNAIQLSWTSVPGAKGYELYRSGDEGVTYKRIYRGNALTYTDKNVKEDDANALKDGQTYYYKVRAYHTVFGSIEAYSYSSPSKHSRDKLLQQAEKWLGYDEKKNGKFKTIIDVYLSYKPLPRDVTPAYSEAWCTTYVTACAIKSDMVDIMPRERICRYMIDLYAELGRWVENDAYVPQPGDLILYDWEDDGKGDCTGAPNHIGIVVSVSGNKIKDIEGNNNDKYGHPVSYRTVNINNKYIRGFMTPAFDVNNGIVFILNSSDVSAFDEEEPQTTETEEPQVPETGEPQEGDSDESQEGDTETPEAVETDAPQDGDAQPDAGADVSDEL